MPSFVRNHDRSAQEKSKVKTCRDVLNKFAAITPQS